MSKFCVDCKHYLFNEIEIIQTFYIIPEKHLCCRNCKTNVITGKLITEFNTLDCKVEREDALRLEQFRCGKEGKYFELKVVE